MKKSALWFLCAAAIAGWLPAEAANLVNETFTYPDGKITTAPGTVWVNNYPPTNEAAVVGGRLVLDDALNESVRTDFSNSLPAGSALYAGLTVNFSALPQGVGNFFAFFRQSITDNLSARVWASTNLAAPGKFRLGIARASELPVLVPRDLSLGQAYRITVRHQTGNNHTSRLWLDAKAEDDTAVMVETLPSDMPVPMGHFGFLQTASFYYGPGNSMGKLTVDNLRVATNFADVELARFTSLTGPPGPAQLGALGMPGLAVELQAAPVLGDSNAWTTMAVTNFDAAGALIVADPPAGGPTNRFYRFAVP
ncbi:MAG: hypothetical protein HY301_08650 [Verrucomicrobia bacterium]|nr:hypothetical protein [Verrucomicrobiota bacterium]